MPDVIDNTNAEVNTLLAPQQAYEQRRGWYMPDVAVVAGMPLFIVAFSLFAYLSRSDVTWNPSVVSVCSVGSWKHSDLPDAVPVVTIVGPSNAASSASCFSCLCLSSELERTAHTRTIPSTPAAAKSRLPAGRK